MNMRGFAVLVEHIYVFSSLFIMEKLSLILCLNELILRF